MNENYIRLCRSAVSVTYCMCVEIRPFRCSYTCDLADVIVYAQCILNFWRRNYFLILARPVYKM